MHCSQCGQLNDDTNAHCVQCGQALGAAGHAAAGYAAPLPAGEVPNYLVQSILVTLACCLPLGIVAIIYSAQVNTKLSVGDRQGAVEASEKAKLFGWIGFGVGLLLVLAWFGLIMLAAMAEA